MAASKNDLEIVREYFAERGFPKCPVCQSDTWTMDLIAQEEEYSGRPLFNDPARNTTSRASLNSMLLSGDTVAIPLAVFVCEECLYVMHFAWKPLVHRVLMQRIRRSEALAATLGKIRREPR